MINAAPIDLSGKPCLLTGADGGIDAHTAKHFAALGARVLTTDRGDGVAGDPKDVARVAPNPASGLSNHFTAQTLLVGGGNVPR